jgi:hypothetical protein
VVIRICVVCQTSTHNPHTTVRTVHTEPLTIRTEPLTIRTADSKRVRSHKNFKNKKQKGEKR